MHRIRITIAALLCVLAAFFLVATFTSNAGGPGKIDSSNAKGVPAVADEEANDPDLPPGWAGKIDKGEYMRRRAEHIDLLRGRPHNLPYEPRERAIQQMEEQEQAIAKAQLSGAAPQPTWSPLGPAPIPNGQTENNSVPVSGRTISIAVHPTNPDIVYVGTAQGGLKKSTDGGNNWVSLFDFQLETLAIGAITIDPIDTNIVYVGTGENGQCGSGCFIGKGLYIVRNANTANPVLTGPFRTNIAGTDIFTGRAIGRILVHPSDNNIVFACTASAIGGNPAARPDDQPPRGIYRSTNAQSFSPTFDQVPITGLGAQDRSVIDMVMDPGNPDLLIATVIGESGDGGIYRTANANVAGPIFVRTRTLPDGATNGRGELAITRNGALVSVYAAVGEISTTAIGGPACTAARAGYVTKSTDAGLTWSTPLPGSTGFCGGQCFYDIAIAVTQDNQTIHLGGSAQGAVNACGSTDVMKRSTNGGTSFQRNAVNLHADEHALAIAPSNQQIVYTGNDGGIWRSDNNGNLWVSKNTSSFSATQFQSLAVHPFDRYFTIGGTQDNGTNCLFADGVTWINCRGGDGGYALIDSNSPDTTNVVMYHTFFNGTQNQIRFERADNTSFAWLNRGCIGASNANSINGMNCTDNVLFYAPMELGPGNPNTVYFGTDRLYRSENKGDTMPAVSQILVPINATQGQVITTIGVSPQDDKVRLVGLRDGHVFATSDGSSTLTDVTGANFPPPNPLDPTRKAVGRAVIDPNNKNTAYISFASFGLPLGQHIWKTTNLNLACGSCASPGTVTWTPSSNGIPDVPVDALVIDPQNSNVIFAGTDIGVYRSTDAGGSWAPFGTGLPRIAVFDTKINNVQRILRIATHGRGIYEIPIPGTLLPVIRTDTTSITSESCGSGNGVVDPGETVTIAYSVRNIGPGPANNLTVTLLPGGGVTSPSAAQNYGTLGPNATASRNFTFTASGACASTITLTFKIEDGGSNLGTQTVQFTLGQRTVGAPTYTENFDGVTAPALPAGWTATSSAAAVAWATTTTVFDTPPNSAAAGGSAVPADNSLTSPMIAIPNAPGTGTNARVQMSFRNNFNTEGNFDGMVLEISVNGGPFQDVVAAGGSFDAGGYNGAIGNTDSVLTGRQAWTGNSNGFITTLVNLPPSSFGQNAQLRWRAAYDTGTNPSGGGTRIDTISIYTVTQICCLPAPNPVSAVSQKSHAGMLFGVDLLNGSRIECREAGPNNSHQIVVTFGSPVTVNGGVTVMSKDGMAMATQNTAGNVVTINLTNVTDAQTLTITLKGVTDGSNTRDVGLNMTVLAGDTNEDTRTNIGDINQTKGRSGQTLSQSNFRSDVNLDSRLNVGDIIFIKAHSGSSVSSRAESNARGR